MRITRGSDHGMLRARKDDSEDCRSEEISLVRRGSVDRRGEGY